MKSNEASWDRILRVVIAAAIAALILLGLIKGTWAIVLGIVGGIFLITALTGFCALYALFGIRTGKQKTQTE